MFRRILIANRGEIASRIIRTCQGLGVQSVAVYSEADADASYLREADEAVLIGESPAAQSYLNQDVLLKVALDTNCEAVHPGYGFLSENAIFATRCEQQKLTFIGPRPHQIRLMGDKATARSTMKSLGLPVMPGSKQILRSVSEAEDLVAQIGLPILLKATAGGGGKGMRLVSSMDELKSQYQEAQLEAQKAFANGDLYAEKFILGARHIEFQILADVYGHVVVLGERECSIQHKNQKLLEESPAMGISDVVRKELTQKIICAVQEISYQGAGTLEFLCDAAGQFYFMEMNTRIQVEHPVTELVTGIDLVAWQIRIAAGEKLSLEPSQIKINGHAIECRINATSVGKITQFSSGASRFDTYIETGSVISPYYDSMIGKLIVWGNGRAQAIAHMQSALDDLQIEGISTTIEFQKQIVSTPRFQTGSYNCAFLQEEKLWQK